MSLYELTTEASALREAERVVSLEGRGFPTLAMQWESRLFDQPWVTTVVLDYTVALPPLVGSQQRFHEVRIAAFVGGASTKFMYFGTEMSASVPRVGPEMENVIGPAGAYQEFRLEEVTCPVPYLRLIQTQPRIYGGGAQDYYSPPIKVERYDAPIVADLLADFFPLVVAGLDPIPGALLTDPGGGAWSGARYLGPTSIAILRQGQVVGVHRRRGRVEREPMPPAIKMRDPRADIRPGWVAVDLGASSTAIAARSERTPAELLRVGARGSVTAPADFETPSEIAFEHLGRTLKAWRERVVQPMTRIDDVRVGQSARALRRSAPAAEQPHRAASALLELPLLRERVERKEAFRMRGHADPDANEALKRPAPPIIDEDGIGAHDPFDPVELFAYYVGLTVNQRTRGLCTHYALTLPAGYSAARRQSLLVAFRRGVYRSLPAGAVPYDDLDALTVVDAGPAALSFAVQAFRTYGIQPRGEVVPFFVIDAGASETGLLGGLYRDAKYHERQDGIERVVEYLEPAHIGWFGGDRLLHRLAQKVYADHATHLRDAGVPFEPLPGEAPIEGSEELFQPSPEARANRVLLQDVLRPLVEAGNSVRLARSVKLFSTQGKLVDVPLEIGIGACCEIVTRAIGDAVFEIRQALAAVVAKIGRGSDPYDGLHVFMAGRFGMSQELVERVRRELPSSVKVHRFSEPDASHLTAPTVRTSTVLGTLSLRYDRVAAVLRSEERDAFRYRVGRARHGEMQDVLEPSAEYDQWREVGACTKPDVEVLFMHATDDGEVAADDPRVMRAVCALGPEAVGQRIYLRAVGPSRIEVSVGASGVDPERTAPRWVVELETSIARPTG